MRGVLLAFFVLFFFLPFSVVSQEDPPMEEEGEEEFDYSNLVQTEKNKAFCSSRVLGQAPIKLLSVGYDFQTAHTLNPSIGGIENQPQNEDINAAHGTRFALNYPVYSKNSFLLNLGLTYSETNYDFKNAAISSQDPLITALNNNALRSMGFTATGFKPLNSKHYIIAQFGANLNGDYAMSNIQSLEYTRFTGALIYGLKSNDRKIWGVGLSRTYLGGALNYVPVYYMLYTAANKKWGLEMLLPARFNYRRNINDKNLLLVGWEVEGNTFRLNNTDDQYQLGFDDLELRRSELRFRVTWEHAISKQFWISAQAGYRYNWSYDIDRGDFFRPFGDDTPFYTETDLTNPAYFNVSINWVSP
ncbi:MAG: hypothetical protein P8H59_02005 [Flavobacteriales bacterium]|nr:hypothetical protein [Flavobacteriales bacterium]MDG2245046.1 hypothetical protein [Flavobacteriales bacterium]